MTRLSLCLLLVGVSLPVIATAEDAKEKAIQKDRMRIEGRWRVTELVVNGNEQDNPKLVVVNKADGTWRLLSKGKEISRGTSTIDPTTRPKTIDFMVTEGEGKGNQQVGIYELGEETRKLAFAPATSSRPTEFSSMPDSGHVLAKFERVDDKNRDSERHSGLLLNSRRS